MWSVAVSAFAVAIDQTGFAVQEQDITLNATKCDNSPLAEKRFWVVMAFQ